MDALSSLSAYSDWGLLALRLALGGLFLAHGLPKLSGKSGGFMQLIGVIETVAALSVLLGLFIQLGAIGIAVVMIGATYKKKFEWHMPYSSTEKMAWEVDLVLLGAALVLLTQGAGRIALDATMFSL